MIEWLIFLSISPEEKKSWMAEQNSPPTILQDFLKKTYVYPSGLGAVSSPILKRACLISSTDTRASRKQ
jgi:hypothetical protein